MCMNLFSDPVGGAFGPVGGSTISPDTRFIRTVTPDERELLISQGQGNRLSTMGSVAAINRARAALNPGSARAGTSVPTVKSKKNTNRQFATSGRGLTGLSDTLLGTSVDRL